MRADRLLSILMLLQTKGRMTAHDLAEQLEVSERTIYRDLEALSMAGVPVYTERGPGGGCALVDGYQTRLTGLTETEVQALFLLNIAGPLADLGLGRALDDAMLKLTAALPQSSREHADFVRQRFHLDTTWWYHTDEPTSCLQILQEALWRDRKLLLFYHEDDGAWSERLAEPYGLVSKAGVWYLIASCHDEKCVFRVTRIHQATLSDESFMRQQDFELASYWSDYCAHIETNRPNYATSLRLAPDKQKDYRNFYTIAAICLLKMMSLLLKETYRLSPSVNNKKMLFHIHRLLLNNGKKLFQIPSRPDHNKKKRHGLKVCQRK